MHPVSITLNFASYAAAAAALAQLGADTKPAAIAPADNPAAGSPVAPLAMVAVAPVSGDNPFAAAPAEPNPFAAAATPTAPAAPASPSVPPAASTPSSVPTATAAVPPAGVAAPQLDKNGIRWDSRVHSSTKGINKDGTWRVKKNLPEATRLQVEIELKAETQARAPTTAAAVPAAPVAAVPTSPVATPTSAPSPAASSPTGAVPPAPAATTTASPQPAAIPATTFGTLMADLAPAMQVPAKMDVINRALADFKLASLAGLAGRGDLVIPFAEYVKPMLNAAF